MKKYHKIEKVAFAGQSLILHVDGERYKFTLSAISPRLAKATSEQRMKYEISPSGYGIHWPMIDEDLSIDGLIGASHGKASVRKSVPA